jgi:hypothetical protein
MAKLPNLKQGSFPAKDPKPMAFPVTSVPFTANISSPVGRPLGGNPQPMPVKDGAPRPNGSRFGNGTNTGC